MNFLARTQFQICSTMAPDPKIIDIISKPRSDGSPYVSLEYFPPRTADGVKNLQARMNRMKENVKPAFTDMTWGAGGSTADLSLQLAQFSHDNGHIANLHMTCTNLGTEGDPKDAVRNALVEAKNGGIRNIVALRGDPPAGQDEWKATDGGFTCALDLVKFIREQFGDEFGISVAGYPEGHPNAISQVVDISSLTKSEQARSSVFEGVTYCCLDADYKKEMDYLKQKVDAGADFIITQMFFDVNVFLQFVTDCRACGINCPVVPGLMCINAYAGFCKMSMFCKTRVPASVQEKMDSIKDDSVAVKAYGMEFGKNVCQAIIDSGASNVLHFYTLNLEKVVYGVLDNLGVTDNALASVNETDAASQVAKGSAWARVGDSVTSIYGEGIVLAMDSSTGACKMEFTKWTLAAGQKPVAFLQKGQYKKVF